MRCQPIGNHPVYNWTKNRQTCLLCDEPSEFDLPLCGACETELPWLRDHCGVCAVPLPASGLICGDCLKRPPSFTRVEAPWRYDFPVDSLITRFKHQAKWPLGRLLAGLLARHLAHAYGEGLPRPDLLLPVPLASKRLRQRGFNQADMLAEWLARSLELRLEKRWLQRNRETAQQQDLDAAARRRNLRQAFALADVEIAGRHVAVVDDVLTTGATAEAVARLLIRAGAARVDIYCLARTPKPGDRHA
jgi:ComF family protein